MNETITEKLFSTAVSLDSEKAELLETAGIEIDRLAAENADLRADLEKVKKIAKAHMDKLPARLNAARIAGRNEAKHSWEEGWEFGRKCEQQMKDENATFTAEIMELESKLEKVAQERDESAADFVRCDLQLKCAERAAEANKKVAERAERALNIATTDKEMALKELGEIREHLAIEVGPEMWHMDEVDKAILAERSRCAEIAKAQVIPGWQRSGNAIAAAIMEEPE